MSSYQIKLTPINNYFFGGEKHSKNPKINNNIEMDYFVKSGLYPQQTALLGLLRYYLLLKNNLLSPQKNNKTSDANALIGDRSFQFGYKDKDGKTEQNFGTIKSLSPLYFMKAEQKYIVAPFDYDFTLIPEYGNYKLLGYDSKKGYQPCLFNLIDNTLVHFFKDENHAEDTNYVFIPVQSVGNKKGIKGKAEDDGFYKQIMYKLNTGWSFAFDAEIDNANFDINNTLLSFGAEQQLFSLNIQKIETTTDFKLSLNRNHPAIYCISDCFVKEDIWQYVAFAVNNNVSFRNLQSSNSSANYSSFSKGYNRSKRYNLLQRGSILYFANAEKMGEAENYFKNLNAENIGFNKIQQINKNITT